MSDPFNPSAAYGGNLGGDAAWMLTSSALVYMMTPALGFFYGGLVSNKHILNTMFLSFVCMGLITIQWFLFGYSFAFGRGSYTWGTFSWGALTNVGLGTNQDYASTYPMLVHMIYQSGFAVITPALMSGTVIGRMKVTSYMIFVTLWSTIVYCPLAHWIWSSNGWLRNMGALSTSPTYGYTNFIGTVDFAGGLVVHTSAGVSSLVLALFLGPRLKPDEEEKENPTPNLPFVVFGAFFLWIGWFGFNGGSALAANAYAGVAFLNSAFAAASGMMTWIILDLIHTPHHITVSGACIGAVAGLATVTPASGYVFPGWGMLIGVIATLGCFYTSRLRQKYFQWIDDTLDVFACHGVGGMLGIFCTGLFASSDWNADNVNGAFYGNPAQLWYEIAGILTTVGWSAGVTFGILLLMKYTVGLRVPAEMEKLGLDGTEHNQNWMVNVLRSRTHKTEVSEQKSPRGQKVNIEMTDRGNAESSAANGSGNANGVVSTVVEKGPWRMFQIDGVPYYYNTETNETTSKRPPGS